MATLAHAPLSPSSGTLSLGAPREATAPTAWVARLKQYFVLDFHALDELDLGTPAEFDAYVCDLFERGPSRPA